MSKNQTLSNKMLVFENKGELRDSNTSHRRVENQQIQSRYLSFEFRINLEHWYKVSALTKLSGF